MATKNNKVGGKKGEPKSLTSAILPLLLTLLSLPNPFFVALSHMTRMSFLFFFFFKDVFAEL